MMAKTHDKEPAVDMDSGIPVREDRTLSRRTFLKMAGSAGAAVGLGAGLGAVLGACGNERATTTTPGAASTTSTVASSSTEATTSTSQASSTTSVAAQVETGDEVTIGFITPKTGGLALFGVPDDYCVARFNEYAKDGIVCGDKKKHSVKVEVRDSQSDSNRAAQVAGELTGKVDFMVVASTVDTINPVADQCEATGVPCLSTDLPWQGYLFPRGGSFDKPFKWTYHFFWGMEDMLANYTSMWQQVPTNKVMGVMWPNNADGGYYSDPVTGEQPAMEAAGYKVIDPGRWQPGSEDFTKEISEFKKAGCEAIAGIFEPSDFVNFWSQARQQGLAPVIGTMDKAILFPQAVDSIGDTAVGLSCCLWWDPSWPYTSSLTGETAQEWGDEFQKRTNLQPTMVLLHGVIFEMANDVLVNATDPHSKDAILAAVQAMKVNTIGGLIDFSAPVTEKPTPGPGHVHPNVYKSPLLAAQWDKGTKYKYELVAVDNTACPDLPVKRKLVAYNVAQGK